MVRAVNYCILQQVRPDLVLRVFLTGVGLLIDRDQTHKTHQPADTVAAAFMAFPSHVPCHSLIVRVFAQQMSREVGAIRTVRTVAIVARTDGAASATVSKNCLSIMSMNRRFSALSPTG